MKLSKSKLALAKVINENGGWAGVADCATQDKDGWVCSYEGKPTRCGDSWKDNGDCLYKYGFDSGEKIQNWHQCVLSREEYYQAYPKADADGWIEWKGGKCPVDKYARIDIRMTGGTTHYDTDTDWGWDADSFKITHYRLHKPEVKPVFCESLMRSIPEPESIDGLCAKVTEENKHQHVDAKPTIEQLAQDYRNAKGYADRKQDEADKASMESDAALSQLEGAIAAIGFVITPLAATVKEPELVAAVKVGDKVECVESNINRYKYNGMVGRLHFIDEIDTSTPYLVDFGEEKIWCHEVKFIRRP